MLFPNTNTTTTTVLGSHKLHHLDSHEWLCKVIEGYECPWKTIEGNKFTLKFIQYTIYTLMEGHIRLNNHNKSNFDKLTTDNNIQI